MGMLTKRSRQMRKRVTAFLTEQGGDVSTEKTCELDLAGGVGGRVIHQQVLFLLKVGEALPLSS